jgi:O-antigen/teichoic acid export membrane protein
MRSWHLAGQTGFAVLSRLAPKAASTLLFALLLRFTGVGDAGIYMLSVAYATAVILFASIGMEELIVREVAQAPSSTYYYWANATALRTLFAGVGYAILILIVVPLLDYSSDVYQVIVILGSAIIPDSITATNAAIFVANRKMGYMAGVACCTSFLYLLAGSVALTRGFGLEVLAWLMVATSWTAAVSSSFVAYRLASRLEMKRADPVVKPLRRVSLRACRDLARGSMPFFLLIALVSLDAELDVILLSRLSSVEELGWYGAARALILVLLLLSQSLRMVIYPAMSRAFVVSEAKLRKIYSDAWFYMALAGLPLAVGGLYVSRSLLVTAYGEAPLIAVSVLNILFGHLLVNFFYQTGTRLLVVSDRQAQLTRLLVVSIAMNVAISVLLTPRYGAVGAATARTLASTAYFLVVEWYISRSVLPGAWPLQRLFGPLVATGVMAGVLAIVHLSHWLLIVLVGAVVYGGTVMLFGIGQARRLQGELQ